MTASPTVAELLREAWTYVALLDSTRLGAEDRQLLETLRVKLKAAVDLLG